MFSSGEREAQIRYLSGDYEIIKHGTYVSCAITGEKIPVDELKYWNHLRQEAYASCEISYQRELECNPHLRKLLGTTKP
ncbi:DUF2093 domain-containing protein [Bartonella sp. LJL80]